MTEISGSLEMPNPHAHLREDVRLLGGILGDTIREQDGQTAFEKVEIVRRLAKGARMGDDSARLQLITLLSSLDDAELLPMARAFSQFLNLANIAEQHHRVRRRRAYQCRTEARPQPGSIEELLGRLSAQRVPAETVIAALESLHIEFVLTAHPTEVSRRTLIRKFDEVAESLARRDHSDLSPQEREDEFVRLRRTITAIWGTDEIRRERPSPVDEARWGLATVENVLWVAVPRFMRELDSACRGHLNMTLPTGSIPVHFASWMGGDRDGNPAVTAAVSEQVVLEARKLAATLYLRDVESLAAELSMHRCSPELAELARGAHEPYRAILGDVAKRLEATIRWADARLTGSQCCEENILHETEELQEPLLLCHRSLVRSNMASVANGSLLDTLRRLACFGIPLLRLDIRQEARVHARALNELTLAHRLGAYSEWTEDDKKAYLMRELQSDARVDFKGRLSPEVREVLATFAWMATVPPSCLGAYVVSMASQPSDILAVMYLQHLAGVRQPVRVVPLFETLYDLERAGDTVRRLLTSTWYRTAVGNRLEVMIGYSDSAKDAGFLAASWAEYRAQEELISICREFGVRLTLFHGRGGSVSRGGAPAHAAILSQPPGSVQGSIRVTEQGEMIRYKFGLPGIAIRTLEVYTAATLEAALVPPTPPKDSWRTLMDQLAGESTRNYRDVVRTNPSFTEYFLSTTPLLELQDLAIGSRPARRTAATDIDSLRAIPWVFAWTQVRLMLPVWLGVVEAFDMAGQSGQESQIREMARDWPFFRAIIDMLEMVLAKAEPTVTAYYEERLTRRELHSVGIDLRRRLMDTVTCLSKITGRKELLTNYPVIRRSINVRNPYTDPLNFLQAEIMCRSRSSNGERREGCEHAMKATIAGIAAGMRNAG